MEKDKPKAKSLSRQSLNIDCPRCGAKPSFECISEEYGIGRRPHVERKRALTTLIRESQSDWIVRKILRERNFAK